LVYPFEGISLDEPASRYNNGKKKVLLKVSYFDITSVLSFAWDQPNSKYLAGP
jgi:hypothetical protein